MAKRVKAVVKMQIPGGRATPAPPVGPALAPQQVNMQAFVKQFNDRTSTQVGTILPVVVTIYEDRSFTFVVKTPPAATLLKKLPGWRRVRASQTSRRLGRSRKIRSVR